MADALGGQARSMYETWRGEDVTQNLTTLVEDVQSDKNIEVFLNSNPFFPIKACFCAYSHPYYEI